MCVSFRPNYYWSTENNFHSCSLAEKMKESNFTGFTHASPSKCGISLEWKEIHLKGSRGNSLLYLVSEVSIWCPSCYTVYQLPARSSWHSKWQQQRRQRQVVNLECRCCENEYAWTHIAGMCLHVLLLF